MNKVMICGHAAGERSPLFKMLDTNPAHWSVVFINNPTEPMPPWVKAKAKNVLHLQFDDVVFPSKSLKMVDQDDIMDALEWVKDKEDVLFACHAGASRSSALAYVCLCQELYPEDAIKLLKPGTHSPNQKVVQIGTGIVNDKRILEVYKEWLVSDYDSDNPGIDIARY